MTKPSPELEKLDLVLMTANSRMFARLMLAFSILLAISLQAPFHAAAQNAVEPDKETQARSGDEQQEWGYRREMVGIRRPMKLPAGQVARSFVTIMDNGEILGRVRHNAVVVGGNATVNGEIGGDLVVVLGSATLGPECEVRGQTVVVGGSLTIDPKAKLHGHPVEVPFPGFTVIAGWVRNGFMLARPLPPQFQWAWYIAGVLFGMNVLLSSLFPRQSKACVDSLDQSPAGALVAGFVGITLFLPLLVVLAVTVVGILVIPFVACSFIGAALFGKLVVYRFAGHQLGEQVRVDAIKTPLLGLTVGTALFYLLYMVPVIGFVVWGLSTVLGFGAVLLTVGKVMRGDGDGSNQSPQTPVSAATIPLDAATPSGQAPSAPPSTLNLDPTTWPRAGFWARATATILDLILVGFVSALTHFPPSILLLLPIYYVAMWTWKGTSVGAIVMGLKVIRSDGRSLDFAASLVRALSSFFSLMVLGLGFLWIAWDRERQAWHDKIAGTIVVKAPRGVTLV